MLESYDDIRSRIAEPPIWFDSNGVPRYEPFSTDMLPNIYADEAVLYRICCQACRERFLVADQQCMTDRLLSTKLTSLAEQIRNGSLHYGDPPAHGDGCSGNTMNCEDLKVLEYWTKKSIEGWPEWQRIPELEIALPDSGACDES